MAEKKEPVVTPMTKNGGGGRVSKPIVQDGKIVSDDADHDSGVRR